MRYVVAVLLLVSFLNRLQAQPQRLDSLLRIVRTQPTADAERMNTLIAIAECYARMAPPKGIVAAREAEAIARSIGSEEGSSQALSACAMSLVETGAVNEADSLLRIALGIQRKRNDSHGIAVICTRLHRVSRDLGDGSKSLITEALARLRGTEYRGDLASALYWTGTDLTTAEDFVLRLDTAKYLFEQVGDSSGIAQCLDMMLRMPPVANDPALATDYMNNALRMVRSVGDRVSEARLLANDVVYAYMDSDYPRALQCGLEAIAVAEAAGCSSTRDQAMNNVASIYEELGDPRSAIPYYRMALGSARQAGSKSDVGMGYASLGSAYLALGELDSALHWNLKHEELTRQMPSQSGGAQLGLGKVYSARKEWSKALDHLLKAVVPVADSDDFLADALEIDLYLGRALLQADEGALRIHGITPEQRWQLARQHLQKVLAVASDREYMKYRKDALYDLSRIAEHNGELGLALDLRAQYDAVKDSVLDADKARAVSLLQVQYETEKKEQRIVLLGKDKEVQAKEIQKQKLVRNGFIGGFALVLVFAGVFLFQRNRIGKEKKRSEELLLNILPAEVAEELKAKGSAEAVHIDQVTVLFTDFKGFTAMSEVLSPRDLVRDLNECFSAFDHITSKYGIEKIKTIGDAYMAAGGLPTPNTTHATDVIKAALEMRDFIAEGKARKVAAGLPYFEIRIGIHTGPVVAGIVGVKKFQYDIWGDTVNTASRMESSGEVGQVNISEATYALVKDAQDVVNGHNPQPATRQPVTEPAFTFTPRGKVQAKGKGEMEMYFVHHS
ncbi:MAG: adenylate/guanylate cyclase domain-containing protein [Flavobacteriales bacterium]